MIRASGDNLSSPHLIPRCAKSPGGQSVSDAPLAVLKKRERERESEREREREFSVTLKESN